jgi:hypothetical protein
MAGRVFASDDHGATWTARPVPTKANLHAVWSDGKHAVAVGDGGVIASYDTTWSITTLAPKLTFHSVWGDGAWVFAVGGDRDTGVIATSGDSGLHWGYRIVHDTTLTAVSGKDADHVIAVGTHGAIYGTSSRFGWEPIVVPDVELSADGNTRSTSNPLLNDDYADVRYATGEWIAIARLGPLVSSKDGRTWSQLEPSQCTSSATAFRRGTDLIVAGLVEHAVFHDGVWKNVDIHPPATLGRMWRTPGGELYSAAYHGGWTPNPRYYSSLGCTGCPAYTNEPYAGAILRSIDDGVTWKQLTR